MPVPEPAGKSQRDFQNCVSAALREINIMPKWLQKSSVKSNHHNFIRASVAINHVGNGKVRSMGTAKVAKIFRNERK